MESKVLRDIAAYLGAPFTGEVAYLPSFVWANHPLVNGALIEALQEYGSKSFKLRLRPISSLTDEEIGQIAILIGYESGAETGYIERKAWFIQFGDVIINSDDGTIYRGYYEQRILINTPAVYAYLQSIHVYVPGTIDPKYVELIDNGK